jgi:hypothetical protein
MQRSRDRRDTSRGFCRQRSWRRTWRIWYGCHYKVRPKGGRRTYRSPFWPFQVFGPSGRGGSGANFAQALLLVRNKVGRLGRILREARAIRLCALRDSEPAQTFASSRYRSRKKYPEVEGIIGLLTSSEVTRVTVTAPVLFPASTHTTALKFSGHGSAYLLFQNRVHRNCECFIMHLFSS